VDVCFIGGTFYAVSHRFTAEMREIAANPHVALTRDRRHRRH
jgi:hypothetical protein